jgi:hypothetical protein
MFGERGIVLCLFSLKFFVQLDTLFTYPIWTVFSVVYSLFYIVLWHALLCVTVFILCIVLCLLVMYALLHKLKLCFPQLKGKCQGITRKDGARPALPTLVLNCLIFIDVSNFLIVTYVPSSVFCVLFVCKCVLLPPGVYPIAVTYILYCNTNFF